MNAPSTSTCLSEPASRRRRCLRWTRERFAAVCIVVTLLPTLPARAQHEPLFVDRGDVGLGLALRRLQSTASLLYITAHPDDEDSALLARLGRGEGHRLGTLTLTRGEGGQNEIGPELRQAIGILRSEELLAVHRLDGVEQFFGSVIDFGYSFSVEETYEAWGHDETVADIVRILRAFRPDVVVTLVPIGAGGGQHHQASARLATEAFFAAGDRSRFPEQFAAGLEPWQPVKLYRAHWGDRDADSSRRMVRVQLGGFDALLGMSYAEFGALARNQHRSQGMNAPPVVGPQSRWYSLAVSFVGTAAEGGALFEGVHTDVVSRLRASLKPLPRGVDLDRWSDTIRAVTNAFRLRDYDELRQQIMSGLAELRRVKRIVDSDAEADSDRPARTEVPFLLEREEEDWVDAAAKSHFLHYDAYVTGDAGAKGDPDGMVVSGEAFVVETEFAHRSPADVSGVSCQLRAPPGWHVETVQAGADRPGRGEVARSRFRVRVPQDAPPTRPYWRRSLEWSGRYSVDTQHCGEPFVAPPLTARWTYTSHGVEAHVDQPVVARSYDPAVARRRSHALKVVPEISVIASPRVVIASSRSDSAPVRVQARVRTNVAAARVDVEVSVTGGWRATPAVAQVELPRGGDEAEISFTLQAPEALEPGSQSIRVVARHGQREYREGYETIAYHHIETRHLFRPAAATLRVVDVEVAGKPNVGYVVGVGDEVDASIQQLGVPVTQLEGTALRSDDLSKYDVIVTGVRAYKDRDDLIASNHRLLDYVKSGGVMIVQYNKYEFNAAQYGPYPLTIHRPHDRVTDEDAPVRALFPEHPILSQPNRLGARDWDGWVQERGLYFLGEWDERYTALLEIEDSFAYNKGPKRGSLVVARYGRGVWVYTGLGLFRQLPAGVPGAYRLLANLLSLKATLVEAGAAAGSR